MAVISESTFKYNAVKCYDFCKDIRNLINSFWQFVGISWFSLCIIIFSLNNLFMTEELRRMREKILEDGLRLNPLYIWSYKITPAPAFNMLGFFGNLMGLFMMAVVLASKININLSSFNIFVFSLVNLLMMFWALYFIRRLIVSFEKGRTKQGFLYNRVAMQLCAIPQLAIALVFIIYFVFHSLFLLKCLKII